MITEGNVHQDFNNSLIITQCVILKLNSFNKNYNMDINSVKIITVCYTLKLFVTQCSSLID